MQKLTVGLDERSYPIHIGSGLIDHLRESLEQVGFPKKVAMITNPTVGELYGQQILDALVANSCDVSVINLPDGEQYKTLETLSEIYDTLIDRRFDRHSGLVALGGGVIGDMVGFAAATFLRGIPFVQIPTTLLAQVDSSVGGKTGVNHPQGKNLIGAFWQPKYVHIDVDLLKSLPEREYSAGLAEVVKYGIIRDGKFFDWLETNQENLLQRDSKALEHAIMTSCQIKADVVENDEKEHGLRAILNLGHTFGHAVEALSGYGLIKHGEAVAIGMVLAARTAEQFQLCTPEQTSRIRTLLQGFQLPVDPPDFTAEQYAQVMQLDKKVKSGTVRVVLNHGIGSAEVHDIDDVTALMHQLLS